MSDDAGPLLVLANRLPFVYEPGGEGLQRRLAPGGLVSALEPVLHKRGGTWVGWAGSHVAAEAVRAEKGDLYRVRAVAVSRTELAGYYHGWCNRTLWPLLHSLPARACFHPSDWHAYVRVNQRFAEAALEELGEHRLVWIHDYHLLLVPALLRSEHPDRRLAFFLHVPFPPPDVFGILPWGQELLRSLLACDLIGFQTGRYARDFLACAARLEGVDVRGGSEVVQSGGRVTRVGAFPIGIDWNHFESLASAAPEPRRRTERIVLGADRLDYTKGIPERIQAVERLLERYPGYRERIVLLQVSVPSRCEVAAYRELKREIDELVRRVNGRFGTATWSPIRFLYQSLSHERLAGLYRDADVALVTPLRDGMNLVAKEFVACQVRSPGVLVLSRHAGAAETLREALLVDPHDVEGTAETLRRALEMGPAERAVRMSALRGYERRHHVHAWAESCLEAAAGGG
jgi:trehalose 6-phosphate synthase/phosphatase